MHAGPAAARCDGAGVDAAGADAPRRRSRGSSAIFFPHGMAPGYWETGAGRPAARRNCRTSSESLEHVKDQTVILSGLWSKSAEPPEGTTGSDHWVAAAYLTGIKPRKTAGSDATVGSPTIDQIIARKIGQETLLPSLQLAVEDPELELQQLRRGVQLLLHEFDFVDRSADAARRAAADQPVADGAEPAGGVRAPVRQRSDAGDAGGAACGRTAASSTRFAASSPRLMKDLGASDRRTVNQYTDEIREIERRIQLAAKASATVPEIDLPPGIPESFDEHIKLHFDLAALAFRADITRVATLLGARDLTARSYVFPKSELFPNGGISVGFHGGSHHQDDPVQIRRYADINRYHVSTLAYFAEKLKATPDGDGTLLDHSLIMYGSNMGNSNQHQHYDVPHILVGGANGQLKGNRHLAYERKTVPSGNLLLSIQDLYGVQLESQGDSTGRLAGLV